ncbi:hypothetical protein BR93DRAFT_593444 [Coniochaeta sp. PMI_546]|nr:hypothetical protein BR93DRAFT_593444 [Coniochaeta sp. PMI_546]
MRDQKNSAPFRRLGVMTAFGITPADIDISTPQGDRIATKSGLGLAGTEPRWKIALPVPLRPRVPELLHPSTLYLVEKSSYCRNHKAALGDDNRRAVDTLSIGADQGKHCRNSSASTAILSMGLAMAQHRKAPEPVDSVSCHISSYRSAWSLPPLPLALVTYLAFYFFPMHDM